MDSNFLQILEGIYIPQSDITLEDQEARDRIDIRLNLSVLVKKDRTVHQIVETIGKLSFRNFYVTLIKAGYHPILDLFFESVAIKNNPYGGIYITDGAVTVETVENNKIPIKCFLRSLKVRLTEQFINGAIEANRDLLEENSITSLELDFQDDRIVIDGHYKKVINIPFHVELIPGAEHNKIKIELSNIRVMGGIYIPSIIKKIILGIAKGSMHSDMVEVDGLTVIINPESAIPIDMDYHIEDFKADNRSLMLSFYTPQEEIPEEKQEIINSCTAT